MQISISELAALLNGVVEGDGSALVNSVAKIEEGKTGALSFLANAKYEEYIYSTGSTAVLVNTSFVATKPISTTLIRVEDAYAAFTFLLEKFSNPTAELKGIEPMSFVDESASLGENSYVGAFAYISKNVSVGEKTRIFPHVFLGANVKVGKNCIIYSGVKIYHECVIGDNCIIHSGTVIGADGFGFAPLPDRSYKKIPQTGNVVIEDDVEIGSNCSIDRATMGSTYIRKGTKLDNLIQVAHNVDIGEHGVLAGQAGVAGSTKLGKYIVVGGQVAIAGHLQIADGNQFGGQAGVQASIKDENQKWFGTPALPLRESLRSSAINRRLPELLSRLEALEKEIKNIKSE
ncbi:MAG: UDP-3-O-(3-hydroxymyristoyl)glucosamine N-acyltransferase [Bacteroidia bacterium]|nr:UDP-3-O-(3-hydroxymyristoyl)glucosamine N-acyltransferase [Bacteroidia bacterium]